MSVAFTDLPRLLGAGAADLQAGLEAADRTVRAPLALNRRIAVVQLHGGSGASATAAAVANHLAPRRAGTVLAVDAAAGERSMLWHAGFGETRAPEPDPRRADPASAADAVAGLARNGSGTVALDLHGAGLRTAIQEADWAAAVAPIARFTEVIVTDWGVRSPAADLGAIAAGAQAVLLVCRAERGPLEEALASALTVATLPHRPRTVIAAVDVGATARPWPHGLAPEAEVHRLPHDRARAGAAAAPGGRTRAATRFAVARLAGALLRQHGEPA